MFPALPMVLGTIDDPQTSSLLSPAVGTLETNRAAEPSPRSTLSRRCLVGTQAGGARRSLSLGITFYATIDADSIRSYMPDVPYLPRVEAALKLCMC